MQISCQSAGCQSGVCKLHRSSVSAAGGFSRSNGWHFGPGQFPCTVDGDSSGHENYGTPIETETMPVSSVLRSVACDLPNVPKHPLVYGTPRFEGSSPS